MENTAFVAPALLTWHALHGRHDLPWQRDPTPFRVWVSETMLQQTQVATAINYYDRFMQRFPDIATLAGGERADGRGGRAANPWELGELACRGGQLAAAARDQQLGGAMQITGARVVA